MVFEFGVIISERTRSNRPTLGELYVGAAGEENQLFNFFCLWKPFDHQETFQVVNNVEECVTFAKAIRIGLKNSSNVQLLENLVCIGLHNEKLILACLLVNILM